MTADRIHGSAPQSSFKRPRITNLLHLPAAELEFLDRRQVRREPGGTIEPDCAGILREHPRADGLEPLFEHTLLRAVPEHAPDPARPGRRSDIDGPHLGAIRRRTFIATRIEGSPADCAEVWAIYVAPSSWSSGVGRMLWHRAQERMLEQGFKTVSAWVFTQNARAIRFYSAAGFAPDLSSVKEFELGGEQVQEIRYARALE